MTSASSDLVTRMREGRRSPAALKIALSHIRSARSDVTVFVFEGIEDVGIYEVWVGRCPVKPVYEPLPGKGKDQLLAFRQMLHADTTGIRQGVFFFVDRDFDGLKEAPPGPDLYVHGTYSAENHLASEQVLESLLNDEMRCAGAPAVRGAVLARFREVRRQFHEEVRGINFRLFLARRCGIRVTDLGDSIAQFVSIELSSIALASGASIAAFVQLEREPTKEEEMANADAFNALTPSQDYRGKYEVQMFTRWVAKLADDRCSERPAAFPDRAKIANMPAALTLRSLATRSLLPADFCDFVANAA